MGAGPHSRDVMAPTSVLVVGATGTQGGAVADHLLDRDGFAVHALTRRPGSTAARSLADRGARIVEGDLADPSSLEPLVAAVDAVFLVTDFWEHGFDGEVTQGINMAEAAAGADVDLLVYTSIEGAPREPAVPHVRSKFAVEEHIRSLDLPATIVRLTFFMQNFEGMRDDVLGGELALPIEPRVPLQLIDVADLGALVGELVADPEAHAGTAIDLAGDELTLRAMAVRFADRTGVDVRATSVPIEPLRSGDPDLVDRYAWLKDEVILDLYQWLNDEGYDAPIDDLGARYDVEFARLEDYLRRAGWDRS